MNDIEQAIRTALARIPQPIHVATVTSTSPVEVSLAGGTGLTASYLDSYTPTTTDVVLILETETDLIILGLIVSGG